MSDGPNERRTALVQGASRGIGLALCEGLLERGYRVVATARAPEASARLVELRGSSPGTLDLVRLDVTREQSIQDAAATVAEAVGSLEILINCAGVLNGAGAGPEKRLEDIDYDATREAFAVNALGPLLMAKHFVHLVDHGRRAVWANLSARVGSIGDNGLGGWYSYRASKAAQNQITKTLSIELRRRAEGVICVALHPGTVETDLSAPFLRRVPAHKLFTASRAARQLLDIIEELEPADSGRFFAWDGKPIEW